MAKPVAATTANAAIAMAGFGVAAPPTWAWCFTDTAFGFLALLTKHILSALSLSPVVVRQHW